MSNHTPGPWEVVYDEEYGEHTIRMSTAIEDRGSFEPQHEISYNHGCWVEEDEGVDYPANKQAREAEANAQLISAAPDMYEACMKALNLLHQHSIYGETELALRSALTKAQGGESDVPEKANGRGDRTDKEVQRRSQYNHQGATQEIVMRD